MISPTIIYTLALFIPVSSFILSSNALYSVWNLFFSHWHFALIFKFRLPFFLSFLFFLFYFWRLLKKVLGFMWLINQIFCWLFGMELLMLSLVEQGILWLMLESKIKRWFIFCVIERDDFIYKIRNRKRVQSNCTLSLFTKQTKKPIQ